MKSNLTWLVIWVGALGAVLLMLVYLIGNAIGENNSLPEYTISINGDVAYVYKKCSADPKVFQKAELELKNNYSIKGATAIDGGECGTVAMRYSIGRD